MEMFDALDRNIDTRHKSQAGSCRHSWVCSCHGDCAVRRLQPKPSRRPKPKRRDARGHRRHGAASRGKPAGHAGGNHRAERRRARAAADRQHHRSRQGGAEHPVPFVRNADRQQLRGAGIHSRHRPDGCHAGRRSGRRRLHRRCLHGPLGGRGHGIPRHRQRADPAWPAGNTVRPQHHRRCGAADHQRTGNRCRQFRSRRRSATTTCVEAFGAFDLPLGDDWSARIALRHAPARRLRQARVGRQGSR